MLFTARRLRLLARIFLALILSLSALLGVAVYLLQRNPEALTRHYLDQLSARTALRSAWRPWMWWSFQYLP